MLFKGRYLIAYYTKKDELLFVADNRNEFKKYYEKIFKKEIDVKIIGSMLANGNNSRIKLIDVEEVQDDIFAEEDALFKEFAAKNKLNMTVAELRKQEALEKGVSLRSVYRAHERDKEVECV